MKAKLVNESFDEMVCRYMLSSMVDVVDYKLDVIEILSKKLK